MSLDLRPAIDQIEQKRRQISADRSVLVAISGIDASGKGFITSRLSDELQTRGFRVAAVNIDGWLNLPARRFSPCSPAKHFYHHAIRFEEMFTRLIFPLRDRRSVRVEADYVEETATEYQKKTYDFDNIDIILLEGIFLLKSEFAAYYDLSFWIDCSFKTALERAISRSQEGLLPDETVQAYRTIYFPAQEIHLEQDRPRVAANTLIHNDPALTKEALQ